jgi:hypothetical protein
MRELRVNVYTIDELEPRAKAVAVANFRAADGSERYGEMQARVRADCERLGIVLRRAGKSHDDFTGSEESFLFEIEVASALNNVVVSTSGRFSQAKITLSCRVETSNLTRELADTDAIVRELVEVCKRERGIELFHTADLESIRASGMIFLSDGSQLPEGVFAFKKRWTVSIIVPGAINRETVEADDEDEAVCIASGRMPREVLGGCKFSVRPAQEDERTTM